MALLEMKDISISFFGTYANDHVNLSVEAGEIHALLGENGAGKTTLMNILYGIYRAESGRIFWQGREVDFRAPQEAIRAGIGMVHQHFSLVNAKTVLDNILLGDEHAPFFLPRRKLRAQVLELSERYGLKVDPDALVGDLSIGEKQRVEILKALYRDIRLLILDEPTAVLTPGETRQLFQVLKALRERGFAVILITHRMSEIMNNTDRITVLRNGRCVGTMRTAETDAAELSALMVGCRLTPPCNTAPCDGGKEMLSLEHVSVFRSGRKRATIEDVSFCVHAGEILGIAGVEGNGQKELAEAIVGIRRRRVRGSIHVEDRDMTGTSVCVRAERGMAYVPDDRQHDALVPGMDIGENLLLREYNHVPFSRGWIFHKKAIRENAEHAVDTYHIRTAGNLGIHSPVRMLSGGNQQKVVLAREITPSARFIVASQPTRGLDVSASAFVHEKLLEQKRLGKGVLLISADLEEILSLSDRIAVMYNGRVAGVLSRAEATVERIGLLMGGMAGNKEAVA